MKQSSFSQSDQFKSFGQVNQDFRKPAAGSSGCKICDILKEVRKERGQAFEYCRDAKNAIGSARGSFAGGQAVIAQQVAGNAQSDKKITQQATATQVVSTQIQQGNTGISHQQ